MSKVISLTGGLRTQGKGSFPRINTHTKEYKENFDKIDWNYSKNRKNKDAK